MFDKHTNYNSLVLRYSRTQGFYTVATREIAAGNPVYEVPCEYLISTYDEDIEDKEMWVNIIRSVQK